MATTAPFYAPPVCAAAPAPEALLWLDRLRAQLLLAHQISGRVRLKFVPAPALDGAWAAVSASAAWTQNLRTVPGVRTVTLNPLARSCVIEYDPRLIPDPAWPDWLAGRSTPAARRLHDLLLALATRLLPPTSSTRPKESS